MILKNILCIEKDKALKGKDKVLKNESIFKSNNDTSLNTGRLRHSLLDSRIW